MKKNNVRSKYMELRNKLKNVTSSNTSPTGYFDDFSRDCNNKSRVCEEIEKVKKECANLEIDFVLSKINDAIREYKTPLKNPIPINRTNKRLLKNLQEHLEKFGSFFTGKEIFYPGKNNIGDCIKTVQKIVGHQYALIKDPGKRKLNHFFHYSIANLTCHFVIDCNMPSKVSWSHICDFLNASLGEKAFNLEAIRKNVSDTDKLLTKIYSSRKN